MNDNLFNHLPFAHFEQASREVLDYLAKRYPFGLWTTTRTDDNDWIMLQTEGNDYEVYEGQCIQWSDSFCSRMVQGLGPTITPRAANVKSYSTSPIYQQLEIGAYVGIPILLENGHLFGTLCAIDKQSKDNALFQAQPLLDLLGKLLGTIAEQELNRIDELRRKFCYADPVLFDHESGLLNRRGWSYSCIQEEQFVKAVGSPIHLIIIEIHDDLSSHIHSDNKLSKIALTIRSTIDKKDRAARLTDELYAVLLAESTAAQVASILQLLTQRLNSIPVKFSICSLKHRSDATIETTTSKAIQQLRQTQANKLEST